MATVFLNGEFVDRADAEVSAFDAGMLHGVGLFETMMGFMRDGEPDIVGLREHMERMSASALALGLSTDLNVNALADVCIETLKRSGLGRARIRLTVTGGDLNLLETAGKSTHHPTVLVVAQPATDYPDAMFENGVMAAVANARANPFDPCAGHKTLNYWWRLRELQHAAAKGAGESLLFQVSNHLAGGCVSNLIAVMGDHLVTPIAQGEERSGGLPSPVLPGITRSVVLGWAEEMGLEVEKRMMTIDDLLEAEELMLTNSSWGVLPVVRVEAQEIRDGKVGPRSRAFVDLWRKRTNLG